MTKVRGSLDTKAKRGFGWEPWYPSWREGFRTGLGRHAAADPAALVEARAGWRRGWAGSRQGASGEVCATES